MPDTNHELLDIYDDNLKWLGTKPRSQVHRDGDWHRVFHCWVIYTDSHEDQFVLMQRRGYDKAIYPGYLDVSAAGHLLAGETPSDGIRELEEELGIVVDFEALIPLGKRMTAYRYEDMIEREVAEVFFYIHAQPLDAYQWQREEVAGLVAVPVVDALALFAGQIDAIDVQAVGFDTTTLHITRDDFIPMLDRYVYKVFVLARRCLSGEDHLVI
jgi:isopentenyldiphosphate isomerase